MAEGVLSKTWRVEKWANMQPWQRVAVDTARYTVAAGAVWLAFGAMKGTPLHVSIACIAVLSAVQGVRQWRRHNATR